MLSVQIKYSVESLCRHFKKTRQAYYKKLRNELSCQESTGTIIAKVKELRLRNLGNGIRQIWQQLKQIYQIHIGRDRLATILRAAGLLMKTKKRRRPSATTTPAAKRPANLRKKVVPLVANIIWSVDITYVKYNNKDAYLSLVIDEFTQKIVGFYVADNLRTESSIKVLKDAIKKEGKAPCIHHSDGGTQYGSYEYQYFLKQHNITQSMTKPGSPQENPKVERLNSTIKNEFKIKKNFPDLKTLRKAVKEAVEAYNYWRPHQTIQYKMPALFHSDSGGALIAAAPPYPPQASISHSS